MATFLRIFAALLGSAVAIALAIAAVFVGAYYYVEPGVPEAAELRTIELQTPLRVFSRDGRLMGRFGEQIRSPVPFAAIPDILVKAVVAAEDDRFFEHSGIDYPATAQAIFRFVVSGGSMDIPGGSTITQQIPRLDDSGLLTRDVTLARKIKEWVLAFRIEREFTKQEILELYLNTYFFGQRSYGVAAAAQTYFGKRLDQIDLSEAAILAGIPQGPSRLNPVYSPENAAARRDYVLRRLVEIGEITPAERDAALAKPVLSREHGPQIELEAPYVTEMVRAEMVRRYGRSALTAGFRVTTTVDSRLQRAANEAVRRTLIDYDERHGYRGPVRRLSGFTPVQLAATYDMEVIELPPAGDDAPIDEASEETPLPFDPEDFSYEPPTAAEEAEWQALLADYDIELGMEAGLVLGVDERAALVFTLSRGRELVGLESVAWAKRYIDDNRWGPRPSTVSEVLSPGDIVRFGTSPEGTLRLGQRPDVQGAFVSLDPQDGALVALVGGLDFSFSPYNRATQAPLQPGSAFKPFVYSAALEHGYTAASIVNDAPIVIESEELETAWKPENYEGRWHGEMRLREALVRSINSIAIRVILDVGVGNTIRHLRRFGFDDDALPREAVLALGAGAVSPIELANGYAILANGGYRTTPYFIQRIENAYGEPIYPLPPAPQKIACTDYAPAPRAGLGLATAIAADGPTCEQRDAAAQSSRRTREPLVDRPSELYPALRQAERAVPEQNVYLISDMMRDVVRRGSGAMAWREMRRGDLSGKTGTTSDELDAWFSGFNADIVATAWVGFDDQRPLGAGEQGGVTAIPMWIHFMREALAGQPERMRARPPGIVDVRINPENGLVASDATTNAIFEKFRIENVPPREPDPVYSAPRLDEPRDPFRN